MILLSSEKDLRRRVSSNDELIENFSKEDAIDEFLILSSRFSNENYYFTEFPDPKHYLNDDSRRYAEQFLNFKTRV